MNVKSHTISHFLCRVFGTANSAEPNVPDMSSAKAEEAATTPENQKKEAVANLNEPQRLNSAQKAEVTSYKFSFSPFHACLHQAFLTKVGGLL